MMTETIYHPDDLHSGKCEWCGQESDELIYTENDEEICIDCYEDQKFFQETMRKSALTAMKIRSFFKKQ